MVRLAFARSVVQPTLRLVARLLASYPLGSRNYGPIGGKSPSEQENENTKNSKQSETRPS